MEINEIIEDFERAVNGLESVRENDLSIEDNELIGDRYAEHGARTCHAQMMAMMYIEKAIKMLKAEIGGLKAEGGDG